MLILRSPSDGRLLGIDLVRRLGPRKRTCTEPTSLGQRKPASPHPWRSLMRWSLGTELSTTSGREINMDMMYTPNSVTPKGVEHGSCRPRFDSSGEHAEFSDAERR